MKIITLFSILLLSGELGVAQDLRIVMIYPVNAVIRIDGKTIKKYDIIKYSGKSVITCADPDANCAAEIANGYRPLTIWPRPEAKKVGAHGVFGYLMETIAPEMIVHNAAGKAAPFDRNADFRVQLSATVKKNRDTARSFMFVPNRFLIIDSINIESPLFTKIDQDHFFYIRVDSGDTHYSKRVPMTGDSLHIASAFYFLSAPGNRTITVMYADGPNAQKDITYNTFRPVFLCGDQLRPEVARLLWGVQDQGIDFKTFLIYSYLKKTYEGVPDLENIRRWLQRSHL